MPAQTDHVFNSVIFEICLFYFRLLLLIFLADWGQDSLRTIQQYHTLLRTSIIVVVVETETINFRITSEAPLFSVLVVCDAHNLRFLVTVTRIRFGTANYSDWPISRPIVRQFKRSKLRIYKI